MRVADGEFLLTYIRDSEGAVCMEQREILMNGTSMTMKLNHLSFPTYDLTATADFFEKYLGFEISTKLGDQAYILKRPGSDVVIEKAGYSHEWPKNVHLGFELPTVNDVRALYDRFKAEGVHMETEILETERGSRFFCRAPGGVMFEMNTRADASEKYRGTFDN
jgi:catechol 2,3-dioxygenase-like lactoylglutathione lyase family enzyme